MKTCFRCEHNIVKEADLGTNGEELCSKMLFLCISGGKSANVIFFIQDTTNPTRKVRSHGQGLLSCFYDKISFESPQMCNMLENSSSNLLED